MVRYVTDGKKYAVFFCDRCGKRLSKEDPGGVVIADLEQFIEDVYTGQDSPSQCEFVCLACQEKEKQA